MKHFLIGTLLLLLLPPCLHAQNTRQYIALAVGPSFPLSDFVKAELYDSTSGWAKTGVALHVDYAYRLTHNFGITAIVSYSGNNFDISAYKSALETAHPDTMFSVESKLNWRSGGILIGPYLRFPLSENLSWDIRGLVGLFGSYSPSLTIRATTIDGEKLPEYLRQSANSLGFGWQVGTGFKARVNKYYVLLFADYVSSHLAFNNASGWDWENKPYQTSFNQHINYLSVTLGLGYNF